MSTLFNLQGKTALITGGRRGIGLAFAKALSLEGVDIAVIGKEADYTNVKNIVEKNGQRFYYLHLDLTKRESRVDIVKKVIEKLGHIDILINNAGYQFLSPAQDYPLEQWDYDVELMLTSVLDLSQQVFTYMKKQNSGKIIHIASISSFQGARNIIGYSTVKHALIGMTKCMSNEWAQYNINVNAIAPGIIETDMSASTVKDKDKADILKSRIPSGKFGTTQDLVGTLIFLSSNASNHIHGTTITVDGGWLGR